MRLKLHSLALVLVFSLLLIGANDSYARKRLYRWVDDEGNVTFSDQVPPDQVQHKRETLNEKERMTGILHFSRLVEATSSLDV